MSLIELCAPRARRPADRDGSFQFRRLEARVTLFAGEFKGRAGNTIILSDFAMSAKVEKSGPPDFGKASLEVQGLPLDVMEQMSTLNMRPMYVKKNLLALFAGDGRAGLTQVFAGTITKAGADFNGAPEVKFKIEARTGYFGSVTAQGENVISGTQPAADFIARQCRAAGLTFTNDGITSSIKNAVFSGSPIEQARQAARQVGAELVIDDDGAVLMANGAARKGNTPVLRADTGLLGYPVMTQNGIELKAIFDPAFRFAGMVKLETEVPKCSGTWRIIKLAHDLEANIPSGGKWESSMTAYYPHLSGAAGRF